MWYLPENPKDPKIENQPEGKPKGTKIAQYWFQGYHADVGGGSVAEGAEDKMEVDEVAFPWMCDQARDFLSFDHETCKQYFDRKLPHPWAPRIAIPGATLLVENSLLEPLNNARL